MQKLGIVLPENLLNDVFNSNFELIKKPCIKENKEIELNYNILEFYQAVLAAEDIPFKDGTFCYEIIRSQAVWVSWLGWCKRVVWFGTKKGDYLYSFIKKN